MPLSLARALDVSILALAVGALLVINLLPQPLQIEVAQSIGTQSTGLEELVAGNVGRVLQQVRDLAKDGRRDTIGMEALEQQERLEVGVGGDLGRHPPGLWGARAMGVGRDGSQRDRRWRQRERRQLDGADGHRMRLGRWARRAGELWEMARMGDVAAFGEEIGKLSSCFCATASTQRRLMAARAWANGTRRSFRRTHAGAGGAQRPTTGALECGYARDDADGRARNNCKRGERLRDHDTETEAHGMAARAATMRWCSRVLGCWQSDGASRAPPASSTNHLRPNQHRESHGHLLSIVPPLIVQSPETPVITADYTGRSCYARSVWLGQAAHLKRLPSPCAACALCLTKAGHKCIPPSIHCYPQHLLFASPSPPLHTLHLPRRAHIYLQRFAYHRNHGGP